MIQDTHAKLTKKRTCMKCVDPSLSGNSIQVCVWRCHLLEKSGVVGLHVYEVCGALLQHGLLLLGCMLQLLALLAGAPKGPAEALQLGPKKLHLRREPM